MKKIFRSALIIILVSVIALVTLKNNKANYIEPRVNYIEPEEPKEVGLGSSVSPATHTELSSSTLPVVRNDILIIVNRHRLVEGLVALKENTILAQGATERAKDLFTSGKLTHDGWVEAYEETGVRVWYKGENLACCFANNEQVVNAWLESPKHRSLLLDEDYEYAGIGVYQDYVVMWFGSGN